MRADEESMAPEMLSNLLDELVIASDQLDYDRARDILLQAVKEYAPNNGIDDLVWLRRSGSDTPAGDRTVVDFPNKTL